MVVTTGEKCIVTLTDGRTIHATFLDVYAHAQGRRFFYQSQMVHKRNPDTRSGLVIDHNEPRQTRRVLSGFCRWFNFPQQTHAEYMAKFQHWTRLQTPEGGLLIISTRNIIKMESLVHDILAEALPRVPIDCLKRVAEFV